ncbi:unnamed protein product [Rotaria magnacalcarata]|uniref:C-type lectin domain-containing protein n=1 Tax=Rotaria magnacalcarata TaxID=392030 RepID=A0A815JKU7_9BILA|nr:unnamed protein product [Rotaria magnacalcarata]CAF3922389.1 unnamed protein product [Rotaria magnacalcarata]CAF3999408.1 unnamed protein product [Rotaria magnacalcarata]
MIVHLSLVFISFVAFSNSQANTIHKACSTGGSTCGAGQACINDICQCDPTHRRFWTGEQHQCRVCPPGYIRARKRRIYFLVVDALCSFSATRCYKYFKEYKNQSEARAVCRKDQADLFTWRDNTDENELLKASAAEWNYNYENVQNQFYSWSGGMVYHGQGGRAEYEITWFDPKGPTIPHPDTGDQLTDRYCNAMTKTNYHGDPEPTRQTRNGERENCVTIVFLPQPKSRGLICMADDFCSSRMGFICELTEATLSGVYQTPPTPDRVLDDILIETSSENEIIDEHSEQTEILSPIEEKQESNLLIYVIVGIVLLIIIGVVTFVVLRYRKKHNPAMNVSPTNSITTSIMSSGDLHENA